MNRVAIASVAALGLTAAVIAHDHLARLVFRAVPSALVTKSTATPPESPPGTAAKKPDRPKSTFDVVRIDPEGASVFAGRAPPNSDVTILADGRTVASAKADDSGAWAAVTERGFAPAEYELSLRAKTESGDETAGQTVRMAVAAPPKRASTPPQAIPVPIAFVYKQATFTSEGREAAARLASHLIAQRSQVVSLSGHADERGSDGYNMELSKQRLDAVAHYLRGQGFAGRLDLIPRGKREPYAGVERHSLSQEKAFQLDRRVEMRLAR